MNFVESNFSFLINFVEIIKEYQQQIFFLQRGYVMEYRILQDHENWYLRLGNKNIQSFGKNKELAEKVLELWKDKYDIIYADPPWKYDFSKSDSRAIENQYPTMELENICKLKIPGKENSILYLWATAPKLREALQVMKSWEFTYKTNMVWVKDKMGMGYYARGRHELLLIGTKGNGNVPATADRQDSILYGTPGAEHSKKPETVYTIIETCYPNKKYLELFARNTRPGWASWGNEIICDSTSQEKTI